MAHGAPRSAPHSASRSAPHSDPHGDPHGDAHVPGLGPDDPLQLGPYRVASRLGRGGMGTVYLAEGPSGPVAIKVINRHLAGDPEFVVRFRREVAAARRVHRFCTAPVLDARLEGDPLWVVTEYVAGPDLGRVLRENGALAGSNVEALAVGVATALTAIHGAGIVHRDLKPGNVLLSPLGPRVIDFGIARALDADDGQTATGAVLGTPEYMAPELLSGERAGPPADVFAWGCVVVAAATGVSPFASRTVQQAFYRVMHDEPDLSRVEAGLRPVVQAALNKDPAARPTAQELLATLVRRPDVDTADVAGTLRLDLSSIASTPAGPPPPTRPRGPLRARLADLGIGAAAGVGAVALVVAATLGLRLLPDRPPAGDDVLYEDRFAADGSGWVNDFTGVESSRGYTGDGRYTMAADSSTTHRWAKAPVNAVLPDDSLVSVKLDLRPAHPGGWNGVYCEYSSDERDESDFFYVLEVRGLGNAKIVKVVGDVWSDVTPDVVVPGFRKENVPLRVTCERGDGEVRLGLWVGDERVAGYTDTDTAKATGRPRIGLHVESPPNARSRAYFDDFSIARLP
ncbi:serine/threonine-protein kinase [Nonomuraea pusilla]|uniref:serine/threonine-protein kinase n=1 Tax=Nonomuraea pusilla TaxID=46177 RepID=UPI0033189179